MIPNRLAIRARYILTLAATLSTLSDAEIQAELLKMRRLLGTGSFDRRSIDQCFALTIEATHRTLGKRHHPVQVMAGLAMLANGMVEMATGEGKTLTSLLPATVRAFRGFGVHVVTANPYLAQRDANTLQPVYEFLGLTVGCLNDDMDLRRKQDQYDCDLTYGTGSDFGFDYLRDCMELGPERPQLPPAMRSSDRAMQRGHYYALIDEADVILIDESGTPLIIGAEQTVRQEDDLLLHWTATAAAKLQPGQHFGIDHRSKKVWLTPQGSNELALIPKSVELGAFGTEHLLDRTEKALAASQLYTKDHDYIVDDDEVRIVDPGTGRVLEGRKWQEGLHQAVEYKEDVTVTGEATIAARITVQQYFQRYTHLCGMTGTAIQVARELRRCYRLKIHRIPTHRPCRRKNFGNRVFVNSAAKHAAIRNRVRELTAEGRAVLIGVPSVRESADLTELLQRSGINCVLLNATQHRREAAIIAGAGQSGAVTIATNMAGRGTDILLSDECRAAGGLHVILTEVNLSRRYDRQLLGRSARQGDPGSFEFVVSLEDELIVTSAPELVAGLAGEATAHADGELSAGVFRSFRRVQKQTERRDATTRRDAWKREQRLQQRRNRAGLDPCLECLD